MIIRLLFKKAMVRMTTSPQSLKRTGNQSGSYSTVNYNVKKGELII